MEKQKLLKIKRHFKKVDPIIFNAMSNLKFNKRINPRKKNKYFASLCREIVSQQLSSYSARAIYKRFLEIFLTPMPTPEQILSIPEQTLRNTGMSWSKVKYLKDLSEKTLSKEVAFGSLESFDDEKVIEELTKVKGVGNWTAEMFLIFTLGRENVFSLGDVGLRRGIEKLYSLKNPTENQIAKIVNRWSPYKSYGAIILWEFMDSDK